MCADAAPDQACRVGDATCSTGCASDVELDLDDHDPGETFGWEKEPAKAALTVEVARLAELQKLLFAEGRQIAARRPPGDGRRRQGRRAARGVHRAQPGRRAGDVVRRAVRGGARPRLPLAGPPAHVPPTARSACSTAATTRTCSSCASRSWRRPAVWRKRYAHIRHVRAAARRRGHDDRQAVPAHLRRGAARAPAGPHRQPRRALEVPPRRPRRPQAVAGVHAGVPRCLGAHVDAGRTVVRRPRRPQVGPQPDRRPHPAAHARAARPAVSRSRSRASRGSSST